MTHNGGALGVTTLDMRLEKRLAPRRNTMIEAKIVFEGGRQRVDCVIRNLSDGGAKLEVGKVIGIPATFDLVAPGHRPHACRVVWRSLKELGVQFIS
jgi:hypothetical protein